jgi:hypothetical protein
MGMFGPHEIFLLVLTADCFKTDRANRLEASVRVQATDENPKILMGGGHSETLLHDADECRTYEREFDTSMQQAPHKKGLCGEALSRIQTGPALD